MTDAVTTLGYRFGQSTYREPSALASALVAEHALAMRHLARGYLMQWLTSVDPDSAEAVARHESLPLIVRPFAVAAELSGGAVCMFANRPLTRAGTAQTARAVLRGESDPAVVMALLDNLDALAGVPGADLPGVPEALYELESQAVRLGEHVPGWDPGRPHLRVALLFAACGGPAAELLEAAADGSGPRRIGWYGRLLARAGTGDAAAAAVAVAFAPEARQAAASADAAREARRRQRRWMLRRTVPLLALLGTVALGWLGLRVWAGLDACQAPGAWCMRLPDHPRALALVDSLLIVANKSGVSAHDARSGEQRWTETMSSVFDLATYDDGRRAVLRMPDGFQRVGLQLGELDHPSPVQVPNCPTDINAVAVDALTGEAVVRCGDHTLHGFDLLAPHHRWTLTMESTVHARPLAVGSYAVAVDKVGSLNALRAIDGRPVWREPAPPGTQVTLLSDRRSLFAHTRWHTLQARELATGALLWERSARASKAMLCGHRLVLADHDRASFIVVDPANGADVLHARYGEGRGRSNWFAHACSADHLLVSKGGTLYAYALQDGARAWTVDVARPLSSEPEVLRAVLDEDRLVALTRGGRLIVMPLPG